MRRTKHVYLLASAKSIFARPGSRRSMRVIMALGALHLVEVHGGRREATLGQKAHDLCVKSTFPALDGCQTQQHN
jgi:hypothetical protein